MSYQIGTGKDSIQTPGQTEQDFLNRFTARQAEIVAYKRQHGGDLEHAYQAVTGEAWPQGRSVKVHGDGRAELTKDRTVASVLGKYVAPIGAGALTALTLGGAAPAFAGLFGGGGTVGGATVGGGVAGGGIGTGALAAGATIPGAGMASGLGGAIAGTAAAGTTAASVLPAATSTGGGVGSWLTKNALSTIVPVAGNLIGTAMQGAANSDAAKIQAKSTQEALDFEKQRYGDITGRLKPFLDAGETATGRMERLMGGSVPPRPPVHTPEPIVPPSAPIPVGSGQTPAAAASAPAMGARKTFPNGKVGVWDGRGWAAEVQA